MTFFDSYELAGEGARAPTEEHPSTIEGPSVPERNDLGSLKL
jgi:hypothetical protein